MSVVTPHGCFLNQQTLIYSFTLDKWFEDGFIFPIWENMSYLFLPKLFYHLIHDYVPYGSFEGHLIYTEVEMASMAYPFFKLDI